MIKRSLFVLPLLFAILIPARPGEGLWLPLLVDSMKLKEMQQMGFMLGADEIYSNSKASLKDAVVIFGGGCTGELISPNGLVITNHHCGYSRIQAHSTVEHNYLNEGFWAGSRREELANPGLSVTFLVRMEDVTSQALAGVEDSISEPERNRKIMDNMDIIEMNALQGNHYEAEVKSFYFGRLYYLFIYEIFKDVRLVGTPPESIGRFGGDTDNWIWPRHTGDFSLFRIYAGKDNLPAEYSPDNVPYKPRKYLSLSLDGVKEGDFTMVLGYPGRTDEYITSQALSMIAEKSLPARVEMRTLRLNAMQNQINKGPAEKLRFSAKYVGISNSWKKWKGVIKGVERSGALQVKANQEKQFSSWAAFQGAGTGFPSLLDQFRHTYDLYEPLFLANEIGNEFLNSVEIFSLANTTLTQYYSLIDSSRSFNKTAIEKLNRYGLNFFRSGLLEIDREILPELLRIYEGSTAEKFHPGLYKTIREEFNHNFRAYTDNILNTSVFTDSTRYRKLMKKSPAYIHKVLWTDPLPAMYREFSHTLLFGVYGSIDSLSLDLNRLYRKYIGGMMAMNPEKSFYPDANFSMRLSFGQVQGYRAADAIDYMYSTTLDGVIEKEDDNVADYRVFPRLKEVYNNRNFGNWSENGRIPVCFIASNHTSGGNSGSPVLNSRGELIGINFDRNWEGTVSDYVYDPAICRNISLDIRYVLFIIDRVAGASWLLDELILVHHP